MAALPHLLSAALLLTSVQALDNGLARKPVMGWNSWTAFATGVNEKDLRDTADFFISSGLAAAGFEFVNSDDGWSLEERDSATGRLVADPVK